MQNVKNKFLHLEKLQNQINSKLDLLETKFMTDEDKFSFEYSDRYKMQCDLDEILKEKDIKNLNPKLCNTGMKEKEVDKNYLQFYERLSNKNKMSNYNNIEENKNDKFTHRSNNSKNPPIKKYVEKGVETDKQILLSYEPLENIGKNNTTLNTNIINNETKHLMHKKQNYFLTNELVNLRVKLNKIKNKNKLLQNILHKDESVKNCKLLEKLVTGFIEKLAVNWDDIVNLIIDDLLEEEIYNLNEIELERIKRQVIQCKFTTFRDIMNNCPEDHNQMSHENIDKESMEEINKMLVGYRKEEDDIFKKYLN
jgi:hypothetical protein